MFFHHILPFTSEQMSYKKVIKTSISSLIYEFERKVKVSHPQFRKIYLTPKGMRYMTRDNLVEGIDDETELRMISHLADIALNKDQPKWKIEELNLAMNKKLVFFNNS